MLVTSITISSRDYGLTQGSAATRSDPSADGCSLSCTRPRRILRQTARRHGEGNTNADRGEALFDELGPRGTGLRIAGVGNWCVCGLAGTDSKNIVICDLFGPAHRVVSIENSKGIFYRVPCVMEQDKLRIQHTKYLNINFSILMSPESLLYNLYRNE